MSASVHQDARDVADSSALPSHADRKLAQLVGGGTVGIDSRRALVGTAAVKLSEAVELLRAAFRLEANDEGDFAGIIREVQEQIDDAMRGCQCALLGMAERDNLAAPARNGSRPVEQPQEPRP